jgi:hypothetical protein
VATSKQKRLAWIAAAAFGAAGATGCRVDIPELFPCQTNAECGDDGAICAPRPGKVSVCCIPVPEECDGKDNDCNGHMDDGAPLEPCYEGPAGTQNVGICRGGERSCVAGQYAGQCALQVLPQSETCNTLDDDCDGQIDEGPLPDDPNHCGTCGNRCASTHQCRNGVCIPSSESICGDELDEDEDGLTDCADEDCGDRTCGASLWCRNLTCVPTSESNCGDGADEDGDTYVDCLDVTDCKGKSCGVGKTCRQSGSCQ